MTTEIRTPQPTAAPNVPAPRSPVSASSTRTPPHRGARRTPLRASVTRAALGTVAAVGCVVALVVAFAATDGATDNATDNGPESSQDRGADAVRGASSEFEGGPIRFGEGPSAAFDDKAAVDAGEVPDFSGDIVIGTYTGGDFGGAVEVTVTNTGDLPATYTATVAATSPDGATRYGTTVVVVDDLVPGRTTAREGVFLTEIPADAVFELVDYSRSRV